MKRFTRWFFYLALLPVVAGFAGWQGWQWWSWAIAPVAAEPTPDATAAAAAEATPAEADEMAIQLEIPPGSTAQEIGENLEQVGLIRSQVAWDLWTRWQSIQDETGSFRAGTYVLSPTDPMPDIARTIWNGEVVELSYTVPEGWSLQQMADYFEEKGFFSAEDFLQATQTIPRDRFPWLPADLPQLEGFLFPDTYVIEGEITPDQIISQMLGQFEQIVLPLYEAAEADTPYTLLEWVTLASIVEKEAVVDSERPIIAGVFAKRLREDIPLGADPTVEYALGIRQTVEQPLTYAQVETPSPYNTYINVGLPPTPIAAPGKASLEVSLNPVETDYLFFMARYDGTHIFSRTLAEHEAAKVAVDESLSESSAGGAAGGEN